MKIGQLRKSGRRTQVHSFLTKAKHGPISGFSTKLKAHFNILVEV